MLGIPDIILEERVLILVTEEAVILTHITDDDSKSSAYQSATHAVERIT